MVSRSSYRHYTLSLLFAALAWVGVAGAADGARTRKPFITLPAGVTPQVEATTAKHAAAPKALPAVGAAVNSNPTTLFAAPFVHDYNEGGVYGNYGVSAAVHGDFRHKGVQDIVTISVDGILTLMTNDGNGHFTNAYKNTSMTAVWVNMGNIYAVDLNGDGWLDVIALDSYAAAYVVWMNKGDGSFADAVRTSAPFPDGMAPGGAYIRPNGMAIGDIDGDGKNDLVFAYSASDYTNNYSLLYLAGLKGNGDGSFQPAVFNSPMQLPQQGYIGGVSLADMNGDGKLDVVVNALMGGGYGSSGYGAFTVVVGDGSIKPGKWTMPSDSQWVEASTTRGGGYVLRDIDGDGVADVLFATGGYDVYLYRGNGAGGFAAPRSVISLDSPAYSITLGDFNRDGYLDAAVFSDSLVRIYNGAANGSFANSFSHEYPGGMAGVQMASSFDMNGDGVEDFVWADPSFNYLVSYRNNGAGDFASYSAVRPANVSSTAPNSTQSSINFTVLAKGDFNGDGLTDLLIEDSTLYLDYAINDGKDGFIFNRAVSESQAATLDLSIVEPIYKDIDGDGYDDIVYAGYNGVTIALSNGKGGVKKFVSSSYPAPLACKPGSGSMGDLNGDGKLDLVIPYGGDASCYASTVTTPSGYFIFKGDGSGAFNSVFYPAGDYLYTAKLADMNHDGKLDILLANSGYPNNTLYVVPGDGSIAPPVSNLSTLYTSTRLISDFTARDLNGDGVADLVVSEYNRYDSSDSGIYSMIGAGDFTFASPVALLAGDFAASLEFSDLNHDGRADLLAVLKPYSMKLNGLAILRANADGSFQTPDVYSVPVDANYHYNPLVLPGAYHRASSHDVALGGGNEYVPGVIFNNADASAIRLSANRTSANVGDDVAFYAQLDNYFDNNATGAVVFTADGVELGSSPINENLASLNTSALAAGSHAIVASYAGDATHEAIVSDPLNVSVKAGDANFNLSSSSTALTLGAGDKAQATISLAANDSFAGSISFSCLGLPSTLHCDFTPASLSLKGAESKSVTLTVARGRATASNPMRSSSALLASALMLFGVTLVGARRKRWLLIAGALVAIALASGCGSSSTKTPPQTVNFTVVAQSTGGANTISRTIPMQVTLQK